MPTFAPVLQCGPDYDALVPADVHGTQLTSSSLGHIGAVHTAEVHDTLKGASENAREAFALKATMAVKATSEKTSSALKAAWVEGHKGIVGLKSDIETTSEVAEMLDQISQP